MLVSLNRLNCVAGQAQWTVAVVGAVLLLCLAQRSLAQTGDPQFKHLKVIIQNESGEPIADAIATPYAFRFVEASTHLSWDKSQLGAQPHFRSDPAGNVSLPFPDSIRFNSEDLTVRQISLRTWHRNYVTSQVHIDLNNDRAHVVLEKGCEVQFSAVDSKDRLLRDFGIWMAGPYATPLWTSDGEEGRISRSVKPGKWQTMLVKLDDDGSALFSNILPVPVRPNQAVRIRNVRLLPGAAVHGKLSEQVARPIRNGRVIATCVPLPAGAAHVREDPSLIWHETTEIQPDGTFGFRSLPRGGELQLVAKCAGWISKSTMANRQQSVTGQLIELTQDSLSLTLEMEPAGMIDVEVIHVHDGPVSGAVVRSSPNLLIHKSGLQSFDRVVASREMLSAQLKGQFTVSDGKLDLVGKQTDQRGRVRFDDLPIGLPIVFSVEHSRFNLPKIDGNRARPYSIQSTRPEFLTLIVQ